MRRGGGLLIGVVAMAGFGIAQQPRVGNARLETRIMTGTLAAEIQKQSGPAWVGYAARAARPGNRSCCWDGRGTQGCGLESKSITSVSAASAQPIALEDSGYLAILLRVVDGKVEKVRTFSLECGLDAGGLPFVWLTGVRAAEGVALLETLSSRDDALAALALQAGVESDAALIKLARDDSAVRTRKQAVFWLSQKASTKALGAIVDALDNDPEIEVKKQAVFALSQLPKDEGVPKLIEVAKSHRNQAVRKQAFFWLGQANDARALAFLEQVLLAGR